MPTEYMWHVWKASTDQMFKCKTTCKSSTRTCWGPHILCSTPEGAMHTAGNQCSWQWTGLNAPKILDHSLELVGHKPSVPIRPTVWHQLDLQQSGAAVGHFRVAVYKLSQDTNTGHIWTWENGQICTVGSIFTLSTVELSTSILGSRFQGFRNIGNRPAFPVPTFYWVGPKEPYCTQVLSVQYAYTCIQ